MKGNQLIIGASLEAVKGLTLRQAMKMYLTLSTNFNFDPVELRSEKEKMMAFIDADVFVTPRFYGFPITFLEAIACGTPIVTTNAGDFIEGIDNDDNEKSNEYSWDRIVRKQEKVYEEVKGDSFKAKKG